MSPVGRFLILGVITATLQGCTHHREMSAEPPVAPAGAETESVSVVMRGERAEARMREGELLSLRDVTLTTEELQGTSTSEVVLPLGEITQVAVRSRSVGARDGALIGAAFGAATGSLLGPACSGCDRTGSMIFATASGALWGLLIGALKSSWTVVDIR